MNKRISILSLLMGLFVCVSVFTSCSKDNDNESSSNSLVGTWYTESESKGYLRYEEMTYNSDGTCTYRRYKSDQTTISDADSGTYKVEGNKLTIVWANYEIFTTTFSISGNKMTTSENGGTTWFKK